MAPLDPLTRLVFLGLISIADDAGRLLDSVKLIDGILFAYTDDSSREPLAKLARMGRIERGETASGQRIIQIANWHHQRIDHPNLKGALPPIAQPLTDDSRDIREDGASDSRAASDSISTSYQLPTTSTNDQKLPLSPAREAERQEQETALPPEVLDFCQRQQNPSAWLASLLAMQKGVGAPGGKAVTVQHLVQACLEMDQLGGEVTPRRFRRVVEQVTEPKYTPGKGDDAEFVAAAKRLQEITSYRDPVRPNALTAEGWQIVTPQERAAIKAIGTMERVLTAKPDQWPWVVRDFVKAQRGAVA